MFTLFVPTTMLFAIVNVFINVECLNSNMHCLQKRTIGVCFTNILCLVILHIQCLLKQTIGVLFSGLRNKSHRQPLHVHNNESATTAGLLLPGYFIIYLLSITVRPYFITDTFKDNALSNTTHTRLLRRIEIRPTVLSVILIKKNCFLLPNLFIIISGRDKTYYFHRHYYT